MLILCEKRRTAFNSEYFLFFRVERLREDFLAESDELKPWGIVGYEITDEEYHVFDSYSSEQIATEAFLGLLENMMEGENIVPLESEESVLEKRNRKLFK